MGLGVVELVSLVAIVSAVVVVARRVRARR